MASEIKVDTIVNAGGDNDTGIDLATNDNIKFNIAGSQKAIIDSTGRLLIGTDSGDAFNDDSMLRLQRAGDRVFIHIKTDADQNSGILFGDVDDDVECAIEYEPANKALTFSTNNNTEAMRIDSSRRLILNKTSFDSSVAGFQVDNDGKGFFTTSGEECCNMNRLASDGDLLKFQQAGSTEGKISVSGSTVSYNGFSGLHESSGIATNVAIGTVVSTIDELDVYSAKQNSESGEEEDHPKAGQIRADHAKIKISDSVGDKRVYGVLQSYDDNGKPLVASVGIGSIKVTGACEGGDLLESNGDGTAKVQSDDIVRSKTIGKVTIGNSNTGVKLVSCVLYCG